MQPYSVLMSIYKNEKAEYFQQALDSMVHQTIMPDEIVLVEDGPLTEPLYQVISDYQHKFPNLFHIVENKKNLGLGLALQKGLLACKNELIARMDTDDISVKKRCELQLKFLEEHKDAAIVGGQIEEFIDDPNHPIAKRTVPETDQELKEFMKTRCPLNHVSVMFRKKAVLEAGNYQEWYWNEDYYLWIRMALQGCHFANLPKTLVNVRVGKDMYARRGGLNYFRSEIGLQKLMYNNEMINFPIYLGNCLKRLVVQVLLPNSAREWVYKRFARK